MDPGKPVPGGPTAPKVGRYCRSIAIRAQRWSSCIVFFLYSGLRQTPDDLTGTEQNVPFLFVKL